MQCGGVHAMHYAYFFWMYGKKIISKPRKMVMMLLPFYTSVQLPLFYLKVLRPLQLIPPENSRWVIIQQLWLVVHMLPQVVKQTLKIQLKWECLCVKCSSVREKWKNCRFVVSLPDIWGINGMKTCTAEVKKWTENKCNGKIAWSRIV